MKIRRKEQHSHIVEGVEPFEDLGWEKVCEWTYVRYPREIWELVPDKPEMVDVTKECIVEKQSILHPPGFFYKRFGQLPDAYEWHTVKAYVIPPEVQLIRVNAGMNALDMIKEYKTICLQVWKVKG